MGRCSHRATTVDRVSRIENEVCIVTGAARGLGKAFAAALGDAGGNVVTCDVLPGADAVVDVSQPDQVRAFVDDVTARHGTVGVAVLNAGVCRFTNALDTPWEQTVEDFEFHIGTNLRGVFLMGRALLPQMAERGRGDIVIIGTDHLCRPADFAYTAPVLDAYDASKWGLMGLVNAWVNAAAAKGVRINSVSMGATDSDMLRSFTKVATGAEPTQEMIDSWMRPADVAQLLVDLIEDGRTSANIPVILGRPIELPEWVPPADGVKGHPYLAVEVRTPT